MTPLTLLAQPGAAGRENPRPIPWQRMLWVTWRQHRAMFVSVPAVLGAASVLLVIAGLKVHHGYANLAACHQDCRTLNLEFNSEDWTLGDTVLILMQFVPALIGAFAGGSVLARDLENGTFRYAWTQGLGRERWTIAKLAVVGVFVTVLAGAFGQLFAWFFAPFLPQEDMTVLDATVFGTRGIAFAAWTLTAFMIAAAGGMLLRRTVPAMAAALGAYLGLALLTWTELRKAYPVSGFWPMQFVEGGWLLVLSVLLAAGTVWLVRHRAALSEVTSMTLSSLPAHPSHPADPAGPAQPDASALPKPVPWRRMVWVTWRQHRPAFISAGAVFGAVILYLVVIGLKIHRDFAALTACRPAGSDCAALASVFTSVDWQVSNGTLVLVNVLPALIGAFAGAPLLARDLETGTFRYLWTQGAGRVRSTVARLVLVGLFLSVLAGVAGEVFAWFFQPAMQNAYMSVLAESVFHSRGLVYPAWTLATFAIGAFCGMLLRRTVPAMAVTMGAYAVLYIVAWRFLNPLYPVSLVTSDARLFAAGPEPANAVNNSPLVISTWQTGPTPWWRYIPVTRFWPMQIAEASWLLVLSVLLIAGTVWLARRRAALLDRRSGFIGWRAARATRPWVEVAVWPRRGISWRFRACHGPPAIS